MSRFFYNLYPILACLGSTAFADMGQMMLSDSKAQIEERRRRPSSCVDRHEELLILGTEIGATAATPIVRFIPFPVAPPGSRAGPRPTRSTTSRRSSINTG